MIEEWKPIKDYEGLYEISNLGRVKSLPKEWEAGSGSILRKGETILKQQPNPAGYLNIDLCDNGVRTTTFIHVLVWSHFGNGGKNSRYMNIDHIDENTTNNNINNLQLITHRENIGRSSKNKAKTSKYTGVYLQKHKYWHSQIVINGKTKYLGHFKTEYEAHLAYQKALKEIKLWLTKCLYLMSI